MFFKAFRTINYSFFMTLLSLLAFQPSTAHADNSVSHGETIKVVVQGEKDLSGPYYIDGAGNIQMPMIGDVHVAGKSPSEIRDHISTRLRDGYIKNPVVSVKSTSVKNVPANAARQIYVVGEVKNPGYYALPPNASHILNIVALAGGYTDKADKKGFEIVRNVKGTHYRKKAQTGALEYLDGDIIIIKERL